MRRLTVSIRRASLKGWIGRSSLSLSCATAFSSRRRRYQRTEGNRKCDANVTAAKSRISRNSQIGSVTVLVMARNGGRKAAHRQWVPVRARARKVPLRKWLLHCSELTGTYYSQYTAPSATILPIRDSGDCP